MRFNTTLLLMMNRTHGQVVLQVLERLFDLNQLRVELPYLDGLTTCQEY